MLNRAQGMLEDLRQELASQMLEARFLLSPTKLCRDCGHPLDSKYQWLVGRCWGDMGGN